MSKYKKNEDILSSMSNLQLNWCLKIDFQKVDQHAGGKWGNPRHLKSQEQSVAKPDWNSDWLKQSLSETVTAPVIKWTNYDIILFPALFWYDTYHYICMLGSLLESTYHQFIQRDMLPWWPLLEYLISTVFASGHCDSFVDRVPVDFICGCPAFKWAAEARL